MTAPDKPAYTITRRPGEGVTAEGPWDDFVLSILAEYGFQYHDLSHGVLYTRLALRLGERQQNEAATRAAAVLAAAGYDVTLDPALGASAPTAGYTPATVPDPARALTALTDRLLTGDNGYEETAELTDAVLGPDGALNRLTSYTWALSLWCARLGHRSGDDLADQLTEHTATLEILGGQLAATATRIAAIGSSWKRPEPSIRDQAVITPMPPHQEPAPVDADGSWPAVSFGAFGTTVVAIGARPGRDPEAARLLAKAGFVYNEEIGLHELPADTHPLDAMLRVEDAADLLTAAGAQDLGADPGLTWWFEQQSRTAAARATTIRATPPPAPPANRTPYGGPASPPTRAR
ncbi:hypothetical protein KNE206_53710 [Kitasatospora sp. NE20-6]|uniref:hypothetical protein n=1 Tax=Kitasatospora sp. NE20-6 TaxID=2859066 RepID=UPI0034DC59D0